MNNNLSNNNGGFSADACTNCTFISNTVYNNTNLGIGVEHSNYTDITNNTISLSHYGLWLSLDNLYTTFADNSITDSLYWGINLGDSNNTLFSNNTVKNSGWWDFYSENSTGNSITNLTINTTLTSFTYDGNLGLLSATSPAADPYFYYNIGKYLNITNESAGAWIYLNISYTDSDMSGMNELTTAIFKYNGSWYNRSDMASTYGVNEVDNYVYANITRFSIFAPMSQLSPGGGETSYPEFSDFAYVLAAVLGVGGFLLVKKRYF
jgi:parallel beta-helix repeat protein